MRVIAVSVLLVMLAGSVHALEVPTSGDSRKYVRPALYGKEVLKYHCADDNLFNPYVQEFYSPAGVNVLRDNIPDHIHHHGLMFAIAVDGADFWSETPGCGKQISKEISPPELSNERTPGATNGFVTKLDWLNPANDQVLLKEVRTVKVFMPENKSLSRLTWQSDFSLPAGKTSAKLSGSHYFGLGMRFPQSWDAIGKFFNADNAEGIIIRGEERNTVSKWCAYTAAPNGKEMTVAMFSDPKNFRPTTWFTMPVAFAYMSATIDLYKEPMEMTGPISLRYGMAVWDAKVNHEVVEQAYQAWLSSLDERQK